MVTFACYYIPSAILRDMQTNYNGYSLKSGIYQIRNLSNERIYIGSAKEFKSRFVTHISSLRKGTHHNKFLQNDFNKCGEEAFVFEVLEVIEGESRFERLLVEQKYIDVYYDNGKSCYNAEKNIKDLKRRFDSVGSALPPKVIRSRKSKENKLICGQQNFTTCIYCKFVAKTNADGYLTKHLQDEHGKTFEQYIVDLQYNGKPPKCGCGFCDDSPEFYRGSFRLFAKHHKTFDWRKEQYVKCFGEPKCPCCSNVITKWNRGTPNKFCSTQCSGKMNGFSLEKTQKSIRKAVKKKYGVSNVMYVKEHRDKAIQNNKRWTQID